MLVKIKMLIKIRMLLIFKLKIFLENILIRKTHIYKKTTFLCQDWIRSKNKKVIKMIIDKNSENNIKLELLIDSK